MNQHIPIITESIPYLTTDQMIEVDRAMLEDYGIDLVRMMENAGRALAHLARARSLNGDPRGKRVVILAGTGGNGGGALVCARRLHNYGAQVQVYTTKASANFTPVAREQLEILVRMGVAIAQAESVSEALSENGSPALIVDGVIGYSLQGAPHSGAAQLIRWANDTSASMAEQANRAPILSLDAPSGVDTTTGTVFAPAIRADATMTLALPKEGLRAPGVEDQVGELYLADISVPPQLYAEAALGFAVGHLFAESDVVRLR